MTIKAKFAGTCRVCARPIRVGEEIEWEKGKGSMHLACKGKPAEPLNSTPPPAPITPDTDLAALAASYGHTLDGPPKTYSYMLREPKGAKGEAVGDIIDTREGKMLVVARTKSQYWSDDDLEDNDFFDMRRGDYFSATAIKIARSAEEIQQREAAAKAAADKKAADEAATKRLHDHLRALRTPPPGWTMVDGAASSFTVTLTASDGTSEQIPQVAVSVPPLESWVKIDEARHDGSYATLYQAGEFRVLDHGSFDDWRQAIMIPPQLLDSYMRAEVARRGLTKAAAEKWLSQYKGCVGSQIYEWALEHLAA